MTDKIHLKVRKSGRRLVSDSLDHFLATEPDGDYFLQVTRKRPQRSNAQNRYYRGVVLKMISMEKGYTRDQIHEMNKVALLMNGTKEVKVIDPLTGIWNGEYETVTDYLFDGSTVPMNTMEFENFMEAVGAMWGVELPPRELYGL